MVETNAVKGRYKAPALEKGLDVLQLLAEAEEPATVTTIAQCLNRSIGEIFRTVKVLEYRGYVALDEAVGGYVLTSRLFNMALRLPTIIALSNIAMPVMRQLCYAISQSCHMTIFSNGEMVVIARVESPDQLGFSVQVGFRQPFTHSASGAVLYFLQPTDVKRNWEAMLPSLYQIEDVEKHWSAAGLKLRHHVAQMPNTATTSVIDVSSGILAGNMSYAALTVPFLKKTSELVTIDDVAYYLRKSCLEVSTRLASLNGD